MIHTSFWRIAPLGLLALPGLAACPSTQPDEPLPCGLDGGGPLLATAQFSAFLFADGGLPACGADSDCVLVQTPCGQSFEECGFTQVAVPLSMESVAEDLASRLTAEQCPASCTTEPTEAPIGGQAQCFIFGTPAAVCNLGVGTSTGVCGVAEAPPVDAGAGSFESHCGFQCTASEFCDISSIESACPDAGGVYVVPSTGQGVCAPVEVESSSCTNDQQCSMGSACLDPATRGPCNSESCQDGGGVCQAACPAAEPTCPKGCDPPLDDGRHCYVCACGSCAGL